MRYVSATLLAGLLLATSPAAAATVACTAKDSAGKHWTEKQTGLLEFSVKTIAGALAKADCQDKSKHPASCKVVACKVTK